MRGLRQRGLAWAAILEVCGWILIALLVYGVLDFLLAFEPKVRMVAGITLAGLAAGWLIVRLTRLWLIDHAVMASQADDLLENRRQPVLTALELGRARATADDSDLQQFLIAESVREAQEELASLPTNAAFPKAELGRDAKRWALQLLAFAVVVTVFWSIASVVLPRITQPWRELPPYSPYKFAVTPETPEVIYGADAAVAVEISGAVVKPSQAVWFLTRSPSGVVHRTACFQEGPGQYAQRLEKVVQPVEFCFAVGKARSAWRGIDLRLQPKIALAAATLTPPTYSNLAERSFLVGAEPFEGLRGSRLRLSVTSNRPLEGGELLVRDPESEDDSAMKSVEGEVVGTDTIIFNWSLQDEADLEIVIRDVRGAVNDEPYHIRQRLRPDHPPEVAMENPPPFVLATPRISVPLAGSAEDDLGLGRVELVRTVVGYRDRMANLTPSERLRDFDFSQKLNLAELGVAAGDVLEVYLEASDSNPSLLGIAASDVARIQVISEEDYAAMIRAKTTVREFTARYHAVMEKIRKLIGLLEKAKQAAEDGTLDNADPNREQNLLERSKEAAEDAGELFDRLANDFSAYDLEQALIDEAAKTGDTIDDIGKQLGEAKTDDPNLPEKIGDMLKELGASRQRLEEQTKKAEDVASIARLMEAAAEFSQLVREQAALERRMRRFEGGVPEKDKSRLKAMGQEQAALRERIDDFERHLEEAADGLPFEATEMAIAADEFLAALRKTRAEFDMERSTSDADNQDGPSALQYSRLALEKLEGLLEGENESMGEDAKKFAAMCQGRNQFGDGGMPGLKETLEQMLGAICMRAGQQPGEGQGKGRGKLPNQGTGAGGVGMGGDANDGYTMGGFSQLNVPVLGPERMQFDQQPASSSGGGADGDTPGRGPSKTIAASETDRLAAEGSDLTATDSIQIDRAPEKYRDAVRRYFSSFEDNE